jgi:AraC-like DNA-binding protein
MIETVFQSDDSQPEDSLAKFDEIQVNSPHPMRVTSDNPANFFATARSLNLAETNVVELTCSTLDVRRTPKMVREFDPELCSILFSLHGRIGVTQAGQEATLSGQDFALYDSRYPFTVRVAADGETARLVRAHIPRSLLPLQDQQINKLLAVPLPGKEGVGALLTQFLTRLVTDASSYRATDMTRLSGIALDLLQATIAHHLEETVEMPPDVHQNVLLQRIETFLRRHLNNTKLTPRTVADAHHISVSYLHRLFQRRGTTVAAWIRHQRLEQARRDLSDPAQLTLPVHRIASRWGFHDHSTFTRAFRASYGTPPSEYRDHALASFGAK